MFVLSYRVARSPLKAQNGVHQEDSPVKKVAKRTRRILDSDDDEEVVNADKQQVKEDVSKAVSTTMSLPTPPPAIPSTPTSSMSPSTPNSVSSSEGISKRKTGKKKWSYKNIYLFIRVFLSLSHSVLHLYVWLLQRGRCSPRGSWTTAAVTVKRRTKPTPRFRRRTMVSEKKEPVWKMATQVSEVNHCEIQQKYRKVLIIADTEWS